MSSGHHAFHVSPVLAVIQKGLLMSRLSIAIFLVMTSASLLPGCSQSVDPLTETVPPARQPHHAARCESIFCNSPLSRVSGCAHGRNGRATGISP